LTLRYRRVTITTANAHERLVGGKGLRFDLSLSHSVERVADDGADLFRMSMIDAVADLLVAGEDNADRPVWNLWVLQQVRRRLHDDGHAGLVVGAEKCRPVGGDQRLADARQQIW